MPDIPVYLKLIGQEEVAKGVEDVKNSFAAAATAAKSALIAFAAYEEIKEGVKRVTAFFMDARKEAQALTQANLQLKAALGFTSIALDEQADALSRKYLIDLKSIKTVQDRISYFTQDENQIKKLTPAILDYAAATGKDAAEATMLITRAMEAEHGQIRGLPGRLDGAAGSAERLTSIVKLLNEKFHDQAGAVAESKDALDKASFGWKKFKETLGTSLFGTTEAKEAQEYRQHLSFIEKYTQADEFYRKVHKDEYEEALAATKSYEDKLQAIKDEALKKQQESLSGLSSVDPQNKKQHEQEEKEQKEALERQKKYNEEVEQGLNEARDQEDKRVKGELANQKFLYDEKTKEIEEYNKNLEDQQKKAYASQARRENQQAAAERKAAEIVFNSKKKTTKSELQLLEDKYKKDKKYLESYGISTVDLTQNFEEAKKEIIIKNAEQGTEQVLKNLESMTQGHKEYQAVYKTAAVMQTTMDTYSSAQAAYKSMAGIPYVGPALGVIAAGIAVAAGLENISKIESAKMAYGGVARGGIPGQDSVPAMLMPGEIVYNPMHPNAALASMITNNNSSGDTHFHIGGPTIQLSGSPSQKTLQQLSQVTQAATHAGVKQALRSMINMGNLKVNPVGKLQLT